MVDHHRALPGKANEEEAAGGMSNEVVRCEGCRTPIAVGRIEAGALTIKCKRCGYKTLVMPQKVCAVRL